MSEFAEPAPLVDSTKKAEDAVSSPSKSHDHNNSNKKNSPSKESEEDPQFLHHQDFVSMPHVTFQDQSNIINNNSSSKDGGGGSNNDNVDWLPSFGGAMMMDGGAGNGVAADGTDHLDNNNFFGGMMMMDAAGGNNNNHGTDFFAMMGRHDDNNNINNINNNATDPFLMMQQGGNSDGAGDFFLMPTGTDLLGSAHFQQQQKPLHETSQIYPQAPHTTPIDVHNQSISNNNSGNTSFIAPPALAAGVTTTASTTSSATRAEHFLAEPQNLKQQQQQQQQLMNASYNCNNNNNNNGGNSPAHPAMHVPPPAASGAHDGTPVHNNNSNHTHHHSQQIHHHNNSSSSSLSSSTASASIATGTAPLVTPSRALQDQFTSSGTRQQQQQQSQYAGRTPQTAVKPAAPNSNLVATGHRPSLVDLNAVDNAITDAKRAIEKIHQTGNNNDNNKNKYNKNATQDDCGNAAAGNTDSLSSAGLADDAAAIVCWNNLEDAHVKALLSRKKLNDSNAGLAMEMLRLAEMLGPHGEMNRLAGLDASTPLLEALPRVVELIEVMFLQHQEPVYKEADFEIGDPFSFLPQPAVTRTA